MFSPASARHHIRRRLFPPRLHIGQLGIGDARRSAPGQVVVSVHLGAARRQQRLFAGLPPDIAPVRRSLTKGHVPKICGVPRLDRVDVDQPGQTFRSRLHDRPGDGRRVRWRRPDPPTAAGPACPQSITRLHHQTAFGGKFHRGHDKAVRVRHETAVRATPVFAARDHVQQFQPVRTQMSGSVKDTPTCLVVPAAAGIDRVHIHLEDCRRCRVHTIGRCTKCRLSSSSAMRAASCTSCTPVHVAVAAARLHFDQMHRGPGRAVMHTGCPTAPDRDAGSRPMQGDTAVCPLRSCLRPMRTRKAHAARRRPAWRQRLSDSRRPFGGLAIDQWFPMRQARLGECGPCQIY